MMDKGKIDEKPLEMTRETVKIEGDRNLYSYTFKEAEEEPAQR